MPNQAVNFGVKIEIKDRSKLELKIRSIYFFAFAYLSKCIEMLLSYYKCSSVSTTFFQVSLRTGPLPKEIGI